MSKSLNRAEIIGNVTRDVQLRYTGSGTAVASFSVATNRSWTANGKKEEAVDFHNVVAWGKLGEICGQLLSKGVKVFISGRMQSRKYQTKEGQDRYIFEIVAEELLVLSSKKTEVSPVEASGIAEPPENYQESEDVSDDIPF